MKYLKYVGGFYLGLILAIIGFPWYTWQYWAVMVPTIILFVLSD